MRPAQALTATVTHRAGSALSCLGCWRACSLVTVLAVVTAQAATITLIMAMR